ncbi:MAG: hypothetical protein AAF597_04350 [Bacteroidota bacterium]
MTHRLLLFACSLLIFSACRDDFSLEGDFQDIPTAYAYLDADDSRHFVRVQKAFLESGGNAVTNAGIADSIYYGTNDATVIMRNLTTGEQVELERVDARDFGRNRADGVFSNDPNIAYTFTEDELNLRERDEVQLLIERPGQTTAVATTTMLESLEIQRPTTEVRVDNPGRPLIMSWTKGDAAKVYDVRIIFNIRELFPQDASQNRDRTLVWEVANAYVDGDGGESQVRFELASPGFYRFLQGALEVDPNVVRRFVNFDVQVTAAGQEVFDLLTLQNANSGITSSGALPRYTNLEGGIGLITSTTQSTNTGITFDRNSLDSLENGQFTRELGFQ